MGDKNYCHFVFRTYKGYRALSDRESVESLYEFIGQVCKDKGFELVECKILRDHVHCLIGFDSNHRPDYVIRMIKGISSRRFFQKYNTNRFVYRKLWGRSYFAEKIDDKGIPNVIRYIKEQTDIYGVDKRITRKSDGSRNRDF